MLVTTEWMRRKYREFNEKYFSGNCPNNIAFKVTTRVDTWGYAQCKFKSDYGEEVYTYDFTIFMSNAYDSPEEVKENTLVHEMIHILDYKLNPQHYVYRDYKGWHKRRNYDAHGPIFFLKEAHRLNQYGFKIEKYVQAEEKSVSQMTTKVQQRIDNKKAKGFILGCVQYNHQHPNTFGKPKDCMWFKTSSVNMFNTIVKNALETSKYYFKEGQHLYYSITGYLTHSDKYEDYGGSRNTFKGWWCTWDEWEKMIQELGTDKELIGQYYFEDMNESVNPLRKVNKQPKVLIDGDNGIAKLNKDGSVTYRIM